MPKNTPTHKERLLKQGLKRFHAAGYHGTSVDTVLQEAAVPKGSFYHHFGSKEGFATAAVRAYYELADAHLQSWVQRRDVPAPERLRGYMEEMADALERLGFRQGCLVGKFSLELAPVSDSFHALLATMLGAWKVSVEGIVTEGQASGTIRHDLSATDLSHLVLTSIQGAVVLCMAHRSSQAMRVAARTVEALLRPA